MKMQANELEFKQAWEEVDEDTRQIYVKMEESEKLRYDEELDAHERAKAALASQESDSAKVSKSASTPSQYAEPNHTKPGRVTSVLTQQSQQSQSESQSQSLPQPQARSQPQPQPQPQTQPLLLHCCMCQQPGAALKKCGSCGTVSYCNAACQNQHWSEHKATCKSARKGAENKAKQEAGRAAVKQDGGRRFENMGSIMAALNMAPRQLQQYGLDDALRACLHGRQEVLQDILHQREPQIDVNWADPGDGSTAALVAAQQGYAQCLTILAKHGADMSRISMAGRAPIHTACEKGHAACLTVLLSSGVDADSITTDKYGVTSAYIAAHHGQAQCLSILAEHGADMSKADADGGAPIHAACKFGHSACLTILLDNGVDASLRTANDYRETPLTICSCNDRVECFSILLSRGSDPNLTGIHIGTAAYIAAECGHAQILSLLAAHHSADMSQMTKAGWAPIHAACQKGQSECLSILLKSGTDVNFLTALYGETPTNIAAQHGQAQCLSILAQNGADMSKADADGWAPIHAACQDGYSACLSILLDSGVDATLFTANKDGETPAHIATQYGYDQCLSILAKHGADMSRVSMAGRAPVHTACEKGHAACLTVLLSSSVDADSITTDKHEQTPAYIAAQHGQAQCLSILAEHGADMSKADADGGVPIHAACHFGHSECLLVLLANGAAKDVNLLSISGATPISICSRSGFVKCLALILDQDKADLHRSDIHGNTAVHEACRHDQWKCLLLLINRGAEINTKNAEGSTPLDIARVYKHADCVRLLRKHCAVGVDMEDLLLVTESDQVQVALSHTTTSTFSFLTSSALSSIKEEVNRVTVAALTQWNNAKICDYPGCHIRKKEVEQMLLCSRCKVATYCCKEHGDLHWRAHRSLCKELRWPD
jgi:ankyrin repeat protein